MICHTQPPTLITVLTAGHGKTPQKRPQHGDMPCPTVTTTVRHGSPSGQARNTHTGNCIHKCAKLSTDEARRRPKLPASCRKLEI